LGVPEWQWVKDWLDTSTEALRPQEEKSESIKIEHEELPLREDYTSGADDSFWDLFPKRDLPSRAKTKINVNNLRKEIVRVAHKMSNTEKRRAETVMKDLQEGADAYQKYPSLPPAIVPNAKSSVENGPLLTDKIFTWTEKEFVAGPFSCPPMPGFRANPLATICRNGKIRPVLNMSGPKGRSFNDNIDQNKIEKVHMSTARKFSYGLRDAGKGAVFSKFDICDAYKLVPAKPVDFRLQGFKWMEKYFCETQQTFGSKASVCNFDRLGNTVGLIVCINSQTPKDMIYRVLDDTPCVSKKGSGICENFSKEMRRLCSAINLPLAKNCVFNDKAFENQTQGVVLGIRFNSETMEWSLPKHKADKVIRRCAEARSAMHMSLNQIQKLMGSVNDVAQLCPLMNLHKGTGNLMLERFRGNENILLPVSKELKEDLKVIEKMADKARTGLPIADRVNKPPMSGLVFYSDAAGASFTMIKGQKVFKDQTGRGVACLGGTEKADIWFGGKITWPEGLLDKTRDEKGADFGSKSTTLEAMGLLIPFLLAPEKVQGRHIIFKVDNIAVRHGWSNGHVKHDSTASEILKTVAYMAAYLGCMVYVEHVPRNSDEMAELADELSRKKNSDEKAVNRTLEKVGFCEAKGAVMDWLKNPSTGGKLVRLLLTELEQKL